MEEDRVERKVQHENKIKKYELMEEQERRVAEEKIQKQKECMLKRISERIRICDPEKVSVKEQF